MSKKQPVMSHDPLAGLDDPVAMAMPGPVNHAGSRGDAGSSGDDATVVVLESTLTIADAAELHEALLGHVRATTPLVLDASDVEIVDTACLQVIAATFRTAAEKGIPVRIDAPSECFVGAVRQIDLGALFGLEDNGQAA